MSRGPRAVRYAASVALILTIVAIRFLIPPFSLAHLYLLFYPAIALAGWFGGFGPGLMATVLAAFALAYLWLPPIYSMRIRDISDATRLLVFVALGFAISVANEVRLRAIRRARQGEEEAARATTRH